MKISLEASNSGSVEVEPLAVGLREGAVRLIVWLIPAFVSSAVFSEGTADGAIGKVRDRLRTDGSGNFCHCEQSNLSYSEVQCKLIVRIRENKQRRCDSCPKNPVL